MKNKKLIIFGDSAFAEIAYEYFTYDSEYEVCAFTIDKEFINKETLFDLPIIPFENIEQKYNPEEYEMHIALVYNKLNRIRMEKYNSAKQKGYTLSNYVSSKSFVWKNVELGDNVFIFEDNTIQPFVKLGSNIVLWSGNHIGHHSTIDDHNFISSHVVISGYVGIGESCFIGVNSTVNNNIVINKDTFIGSGSLITKNIKKGSFVYGNRSEIADVTSYKKFKIDELD
jgi:sugar O-acyltransferase (sialic acid O-acetyltransferase NeuD family)